MKRSGKIAVFVLILHNFPVILRIVKRKEHFVAFDDFRKGGAKGILEEPGSAVFSTNFKKLRISCGMTQDDMAKLLNISRSCVANYEAEKRQPDQEMIRKIADYFHVSIDFLLGRSLIKMTVPDSDRMRKLQQLGNVLDAEDKLDLRNAEPRVKIALIEFYNYLSTTV